MAKRKIIKIDEEKCNGCGLCIPNCPEGALAIIDGKARLISDLFCDGLGACIGHCPQGAINIEEREATSYDEKKVMENIVKQGKNTIIAHLNHLKEHNEFSYLKEAMDYLMVKGIKVRPSDLVSAQHSETARSGELKTWPIQLRLVPAFAPFLNNADILIAADCVPFAYADFHEDLLKGRILLVGCPKLDDIQYYKEKITQIVNNNDIRSITYAHMEVPCCFGLLPVIKEAIKASGKDVPFKDVTISIKGEKVK